MRKEEKVQRNYNVGLLCSVVYTMLVVVVIIILKKRRKRDDMTIT